MTSFSSCMHTWVTPTGASAGSRVRQYCLCVSAGFAVDGDAKNQSLRPRRMRSHENAWLQKVTPPLCFEYEMRRLPVAGRNGGRP